MLDIKFVRSNPDLVKENIRKKFQDEKLPLVDEVIALDEQLRAAKTRGDELRALRNTVSREIGGFMKQGLKDKAEEAKKKVAEIADELAALEKQEEEYLKQLLIKKLSPKQSMNMLLFVGLIMVDMGLL